MSSTAPSEARHTRFHKAAHWIANHPVRMRTLNACSLLVSAALAVTALVFMGNILDSYAQVDTKSAAYEQCDWAVKDLQDASDYLTDQARDYVETGTRSHMDNYLAELYIRDRRGTALQTLKDNASDTAAVNALEQAVRSSDDLTLTELYAMRLVADAAAMQDMPEALAGVELSQQDQDLAPAQKRSCAHTLVLGDDYATDKLHITEHVQECSSILMDNMKHELERSRRHLERLIQGMRICVVALLLMVGFVIASSSKLIIIPMARHEQHIRNDEPLSPIGALELRYLVAAYNDMYDKNHDRASRLQMQVEIDPLTGVFNRGAYESLVEKHRHSMALILVDVDDFKHFNDEYGHDMGDAVLTEVAATLFDSFRSSDHVCRIGGDEFAVIMTDADSSTRDLIERKVEKIATFLADGSNGIPPVTVSIGVAFADMAGRNCDDLFHAADEALYTTKRRGRNGLTFAPVV